MDFAQVEADTRRWLERAVIGLNLCPFAKAVYVKNQVRIVISDASTERALLEELGEELARLRDTPSDSSVGPRAMAVVSAAASSSLGTGPASDVSAISASVWGSRAR